jgi:hypothetical protein
VHVRAARVGAGAGQETSSLDADSSGGLVTCARLAPSCRASWSRRQLFSARRRVISTPAASKRRSELTLPGKRPQGRAGASGHAVAELDGRRQIRDLRRSLADEIAQPRTCPFVKSKVAEAQTSRRFTQRNAGWFDLSA